MNPIQIDARLPLHFLIRRRRQQLGLLQADIAEACHVTPESVTQWEAGRRRMELSKIPRLANALHMNARELCIKALQEFHPPVYHTLFGDRTTAHSV